MKDSFITLDKIGFDDMVVKSKYLKIVHHYHGNYIVQVNDQGMIIDSHYVFTVVLDERNQ